MFVYYFYKHSNVKYSQSGFMWLIVKVLDFMEINSVSANWVTCKIIASAFLTHLMINSYVLLNLWMLRFAHLNLAYQIHGLHIINCSQHLSMQTYRQKNIPLPFSLSTYQISECVLILTDYTLNIFSVA